MKWIATPTGFKLWLSAQDTFQWASRLNSRWPCSVIADRRLFVEFDSNGLMECAVVNGGRGDQNVPADELNAIVYDHVRTRLSQDNPAWEVAVNQFSKPQLAAVRTGRTRS